MLHGYAILVGKIFSERLPLKFLYVSGSFLMPSTMEMSGSISVSPAWNFRIIVTFLRLIFEVEIFHEHKA